MARQDLSNWIIHFIHGRNIENELFESSYSLDDGQYSIPDGFSYHGEPIRLTSKYEEDDYGLNEDADGFEVLKKILHDGIIRSGWSFRKSKPTIYGPKAATCFTEMPLYALIEYSKTRNSQSSIEPYGIAFLKNELYNAGARPVIYGLSGKHLESKKGEANFGIGLRTLSSECGIGIREMYRYVYTNLSAGRNVTWMHEREWRWADVDETNEFAGLPFYALNDFIKFNRLIIIVKTKKESEEIIEYLMHLIHSGSTDFAREYDIKLIERTHVLALEELDSLVKDPLKVNLDDLPLNSVPRLPKIIVPKEILEKVKTAIECASTICYKESEKDYEAHGDYDVSGFCHIVTYDVKSEITQALIDLDIAHSYGKGSYTVYIKSYPVQGLGTQEIGHKAAAEYLTAELGQKFYTKSRWD
ncbi:hypothetical protein [Pseudomonas shirazensis]